jgi:hypothetical protein
MDRALDPQGRRRDDPDRLAELAPAAGLRVREVRPLATAGYEETPADVARKLETRSYSSLWNATEEQWRTVVEPTIRAVRALPDPAAPIRRFAHNSLVVFDHPRQQVR